MKFILFIAVSFASLLSQESFSQGKKMERTFSDYLNTVAKDTDAIRLRAGLEDSVQSWIDKKLDYALFLGSTNWKIDSAVFYNQDKSKALLVILFQPHSNNWKFDYSKIITAEKIENKWQFYYVGMALRVSDRRNGKRVSFSKLADDARFQVWSGGFISCDKECRVNHAFVDTGAWFPASRKEQHARFLSNTLPRGPFGNAEKLPH